MYRLPTEQLWPNCLSPCTSVSPLYCEDVHFCLSKIVTKIRSDEACKVALCPVLSQWDCGIEQI